MAITPIDTDFGPAATSEPIGATVTVRPAGVGEGDLLIEFRPDYMLVWARSDSDEKWKQSAVYKMP